jgi:hypothetical protein
MVLAHDPATGKSYGFEPDCGPNDSVVPNMLNWFLFDLRRKAINPSEFVFDVLKCKEGERAYMPIRELSYEEVCKLAERNLTIEKSHE